MRTLVFFFFLSLWNQQSFAQDRPYPIGFSVPRAKVIRTIPKKYRDFAFLHPLNLGTYIYRQEELYYLDYQRSYFALTCKKGGWDCMRHYEILANGCIPYFLDIDKCDEETLFFFPKELIKEAMHLPGVRYPYIDHTKFDKAKYHDLLSRIMDYVRAHLTSDKMAQYILDTLHYSGKGKILYLSDDVYTDYLRCLTLIGFKDLLQDRIVDVPKIEHIYQSYSGDISTLYGKGFTYAKNVEDLPVDRENIEERIRNREFDLIIYGSVHRGLRYHDLVREVYHPDEIAYLCGEDEQKCGYIHYHNLFLREFGGN